MVFVCHRHLQMHVIKECELAETVPVLNIPGFAPLISHKTGCNIILVQPAPSIMRPLQVMKYLALFRTTPIFFKSSNRSPPCFLALTILWADFTPMPGTLRSSP